MKNTSISLGNYFDNFVSSQVSGGRYKNVSEVVRAGLRLLEDEESKVIALKNAIQKGLESPRVENFDFDAHLTKLKSSKCKTLRQEAIDDLNDIWNYTKTQWSENQAEKYYQTIKSSCKLIAENPNIEKS